MNQLVREYLATLAGKPDAETVADEFERISRASRGNSRGWTFNSDELHERK